MLVRNSLYLIATQEMKDYISRQLKIEGNIMYGKCIFHFLFKNLKISCLNNWSKNRNNCDLKICRFIFQIPQTWCWVSTLLHEQRQARIKIQGLETKCKTNFSWYKCTLWVVSPLVYLLPSVPNHFSVEYFNNWVLLSLSRHLLDRDKDYIMLITVRKQNKTDFVFNLSTRTIRRRPCQLSNIALQCGGWLHGRLRFKSRLSYLPDLSTAGFPLPSQWLNISV